LREQAEQIASFNKKLGMLKHAKEDEEEKQDITHSFSSRILEN